MSPAARQRLLAIPLVGLLAATMLWALRLGAPVSWDPPPYRWIVELLLGLIGVLLSFAALIMIPAGGVIAAVSKTRRVPGLFAVAIGLAWFGGCAASSLLRPSDTDSLDHTVERANRVVEAIESFQHDTGRPPASIAALMPTYLTHRDLPSGRTTLRYSSITSSDQVWFSWDYDLAGSSNAPAASFGGPLLEVGFSGLGEVRKTSVRFFHDRVVTPAEFNAAGWAKGDTGQLGMALTIRNSDMLVGRDTSEVSRLLGEPTRRSQEYPGEWFLAVATTDLFGDYSALILDSPTAPSTDAGNATRIGRWWYCPGCYERLPDP